MKTFKITKEFAFELGHVLDGHKGKCRNVHGHNYKVLVTVESTTLDDMEMVIDFYDLSAMIKPNFEEFEHAFAININAKDPFENDIAQLLKKHNRKIINLPFRTTAENMAKYFFDKIGKSLNCNNYWISKVIVYETPTSYAEYGEKG